MSDDLTMAARRLRLGPVRGLTVDQAQEARDCIGCVAEFDRGLKVVRVVPGCPAHSARALNQQQKQGETP